WRRERARLRCANMPPAQGPRQTWVRRVLLRAVIGVVSIDVALYLVRSKAEPFFLSILDSAAQQSGASTVWHRLLVWAFDNPLPASLSMLALVVSAERGHALYGRLRAQAEPLKTAIDNAAEDEKFQKDMKARAAQRPAADEEEETQKAPKELVDLL